MIDLVRRSTAPAALVATAALLVGCGAKGDEASPTTTQIDRTTTSGAAPSTTGATTTTTDDVTSTTAVQSPIGARAEAQQAFLGAVASLNAAIGAWEVANGAVTETPTVVIRWCSTIGPELAGAADALQARNDWDGAEGQVSRFALALRSEAAIHAECAVAAASFDALDPILDRLEPAEDESVAAAAAARTALGLPPA